MSLLLASARVVQPWKNGGGLASEVARSGVGTPAVPFDWRLTMATIDRDGAFSDFSGVDRVLLNAGPDGLTLVIGGRTRRLDPLSVVAFAGEAAVTSTAVHRPTQALNLMLRRHRASGTLRSLGIDGPTVFKAADDEVVVVVVLSGAVRVDEHDLVVHDAVQASGQSVAVTGSGVVAIARIVL